MFGSKSTNLPCILKLRLKILLIICLNTIFSMLCFSQIGGQNTYEFLNFTNSARIASLGGNQISIKDNDLNFVFSNPSLLTSSLDNNLVINYYNDIINYHCISSDLKTKLGIIMYKARKTKLYADIYSIRE